jgi:hypothetical protein
MRMLERIGDDGGGIQGTEGVVKGTITIRPILCCSKSWPEVDLY